MPLLLELGNLNPFLHTSYFYFYFLKTFYNLSENSWCPPSFWHPSMYVSFVQPTFNCNQLCWASTFFLCLQLLLPKCRWCNKNSALEKHIYMHHGWCLFYFSVIIYSLPCVTGGDLERLVRETEGKIISNCKAYWILHLLDGHDIFCIFSCCMCIIKWLTVNVCEPFRVLMQLRKSTIEFLMVLLHSLRILLLHLES